MDKGCTLRFFLGEFLASERSGKGGDVLIGELEMEFRNSERGGMGRPPEVLFVLGIGPEVSVLVGGGGGCWYV